MRIPGAHVRKTCAGLWKCSHRAPSAPLISNTGCVFEKVFMSDVTCAFEIGFHIYNDVHLRQCVFFQFLFY